MDCAIGAFSIIHRLSFRLALDELLLQEVSKTMVVTSMQPDIEGLGNVQTMHWIKDSWLLICNWQRSRGCER